MNFALSELKKENKFDNYEAFFLLTNDSEFDNKPYIKILYNITAGEIKSRIDNII